MIILTLNNKGGVGKTTLALEVAAGLERLLGARVRGVDLDAGQLAIDGEVFETGGSFIDWCRGRGAQSALRLAVERPLRPLSTEELLALDQQQDALVLDGPIALSEATLQALVAADVVLVPVRPAIFDLRATSNLFAPGRPGAPSLLHLVATARARRGLAPQRVVAVLNFVEPHPQNRELAAVGPLAKEAAIEVLPALFTRRLAYQRAQQLGESVLTAYPWERAAVEVAQLVGCVYRAFQGATAADLAAAVAALPPGLEPGQVAQRLLGHAPAHEVHHAAA